MTRTPLGLSFRRLLAAALRDAKPETQAEPGRAGPRPEAPADDYSRRDFLRIAGLAAGAGLTLAQMPRLSWAETPARIVIVGGGIAGLSAAYWLKERYGLDAQVYEARTRLGGRMYSATGRLGPGLTTDLGGAFINTDHADMRHFAERFGLELVPVAEIIADAGLPPEAFVIDGRRRSEAELAEELLPLARQMAGDARLIDGDDPAPARRLDRLSVAEYLDRHRDLVTPASRALVEAVIRSEYGVELNESSALQLLYILPAVEDGDLNLLSASDEAFMVAGGSGRIIDALGERLGNAVHTGWVLKRIEAAADGYRLRFDQDREVTADYVILAMPFTVLRRIDVAVDLPAGLRRFIRTAQLGRNEKVQGGFERRPWRSPDGFVASLWTDKRYSMAWDATIRDPGRRDGVLTFFHGGADADAIRGGARARALGSAYVEALDQQVPGLAAAATGRWQRTNWTLSPFTRGAYTSFAPGQLTDFADWFYIDGETAAERQDVIVGNLAFAGEQLSDAFYGYMNGGAETGRMAARAIAERMAAEQRPEAGAA